MRGARYDLQTRRTDYGHNPAMNRQFSNAPFYNSDEEKPWYKEGTMRSRREPVKQSELFDVEYYVNDEMTKRPYDRYLFGDEVETLPDKNDPTLHACPICKSLYNTATEAYECRNQPYDTGGLKVGDIVVIPGKYTTWYDENDPLVAFTIPADMSSSCHFDHNRQHVPYYVVTAMHPDRFDPHRCLVTVATLVDGKVSAGWNPANGDGLCSLYKVGVKTECPEHTNQEWHDRFAHFLDKLEPCAIVKEEARQLAAARIQSRCLL